MANVVWPDRRADVVEALRVPADVEHQARWFTEQSAPPSLTDAVHWLIDDTSLDTKPASSLIPEVLTGESEAAAVDRVVAELMVILTSLGPTRPDREYLEHSNWPEVVTSSAAALAALMQ